MKKKAKIDFLIDPELKHKFKVWCVVNRKDMTKVLTDYIKQLVEENKKDTANG